MIQINNINDLFSLIKKNDLPQIQIIEIIEQALNIFILPEKNQNLEAEVKAYWSKYGIKPLGERPLFLDETIIDITNLMQSPTAKKINNNLEAYY